MTKKTDAIELSDKAKRLKLIKNTVAKDATDDELDMFMHYCKSAGVDPLRKQAHFIVKEYKDYNGKMQRNTTMMIGIDGFQARVTSDPRYLGIQAHAVRENDEFSFDTITGGVTHKITGTARGKVVGAYAVLLREGMPNACEWVAFDEYTTGKSTWSKMPEVMIVKVARATVLRREYPDNFSGSYIPEEFGAEITEDGKFIPAPDEKKKLSPTKQPKVNKPDMKQCTGCGGALPKDNESGLCAKCMTKPIEEGDSACGGIALSSNKEKMVDADSKEIEEKDEPSESIIDTDESKPNSEFLIPKSAIKSCKTPWDAIDKIVYYATENSIPETKVIFLKYIPDWNAGTEINDVDEKIVIDLVKELTGKKFRKSKKED